MVLQRCQSVPRATASYSAGRTGVTCPEVLQHQVYTKLYSVYIQSVHIQRIHIQSVLIKSFVFVSNLQFSGLVQ